MPQIVPDDRARQGGSGRPVLGVLIGALVLLAISITGYMIWVGRTSPDSVSQDASRQQITGDAKGDAQSTNKISPANPAYPAPPADPSATGATKP